MLKPLHLLVLHHAPKASTIIRRVDGRNAPTTHLFPFQIWQRIGDKVKEDTALTDLLDEELLLVGDGGVLDEGQLHKLPVLGYVEPVQQEKCT